MSKLVDRLPLCLGTAVWMEEGRERQALVAPLPSDPSRIVDLHGIEVARLTRLGEGRPDALAEVLLPSRLQSLLESGPRAFHRARLALAYAEKWHRRGDLPELLAFPLSHVRLLACLPEPLGMRSANGQILDTHQVQGPGAILGRWPQPTLAMVGWRGGGLAGYCLALEDAHGAVLGAWFKPDMDFEGNFELWVGDHRRTSPMATWLDMELPRLGPGEIQLLPSPRFRALPELVPGATFRLKAPFETLELSLGDELVHPTLQ
ncbi:MAG: hypothetical protein Q8O00_00405 [Holophaga sp.]|nr:hypothetical protein [Holophaga sp.]